MNAYRHVVEDIETVLRKDPAAKSWVEVVLLYPGVHAVWLYRIAHWFWEHGFRLTGRFISEFARQFRGVEIHPGAEIGRRFFIDHGMGTVIGETAIIGDDVHMYHGVTLGAAEITEGKRHPTIGDDVRIGADARVLGDIYIGDSAVIASGATVVSDVDPEVTLVEETAVTEV